MMMMKKVKALRGTRKVQGYGVANHLFVMKVEIEVTLGRANTTGVYATHVRFSGTFLSLHIRSTGLT